MVTMIFFASIAMARVSPSRASESLMIFAMRLAVAQLADGSSRMSVNRPLESMTWAGRSASMTAPPAAALIDADRGRAGIFEVNGPFSQGQERPAWNRALHGRDEESSAAKAGRGADAGDIDVKMVAVANTVARDRGGGYDDRDVGSVGELGDGDRVGEFGEHGSEGIDGGGEGAAVAGAFESVHKSETGEDVGAFAADARDVGDFDGEGVGRSDNQEGHQGEQSQGDASLEPVGPSACAPPLNGAAFCDGRSVVLERIMTYPTANNPIVRMGRSSPIIAGMRPRLVVSRT